MGTKSKYIIISILFCGFLATGVAPCGTSACAVVFGVHTTVFPVVGADMLR